MTVGPEDHLLAGRIATAAGRLLVEVRDQLGTAGADAPTLGQEGDRRSHDLIAAALTRAHPDDAVLSEEGADDPRRATAERLWIVDPLDGTREYGEPPRADWAVHVALVVSGVPVVGAVALPAQRRTLATQPAPPPLPPAPERPRVIVSRSRPPAVALTVAEALGADVVEMGSAGAKAMAVVLGAADVYVHAGGQYEWDSAAPVAVALAAGLHASRLDGSSLTYGHADPYLPDLLICRRELAEQVLATVS
ncbi:3'(2'),5'-bisphosphate nucleotidase CysQ [soil metagenome]